MEKNVIDEKFTIDLLKLIFMIIEMNESTIQIFDAYNLLFSILLQVIF
jgi:hypothetical protein